MQPPPVQPPQMQALPGGSPGSPTAAGGPVEAAGLGTGAATGAAEVLPVLLV
jgi:hypothetical protein